MDKFDAFRSAYADYPYQDSEGWVPDRGSFKAGFMAAWSVFENEITLARSRLGPAGYKILEEYQAMNKELVKYREAARALAALSGEVGTK
jgi:hypothetical protein